MKQYTMKEFIKGKFAVKVNKNNCKEFLEMCAKYRLRWVSGEKANEFIPNFDIESELAIECEERRDGMGLVYVRAYVMKVLEKYGMPFIDCKDFMGSNVHFGYQILIECDGTTTTATMTINGREIKTAIARRNPEDKFDWRKGAKVAFDRLWDSQRKVEKRPEVREVKRFAKPGEYIKIVYVCDGCENYYHKGDIFLVTRSHQGTLNGCVNVKGISVAMHPTEYAVLEGYRP